MQEKLEKVLYCYLFLIYTSNSNNFTGKVQYSGCTISHGAMEGGFWRNTEELRLTSIWAIYDPEGLYELGMADLNEESESSTGQFLELFSLPFGKSTQYQKYFEFESNLPFWLEPICCKKQQKNVPDQLLVCVIWDF